MDTRLIQMFAVLARHLSFTRAADELGIPQPHLSRLIQRLEDVVGARLLDRTSRQTRLTPAGEALLAESDAVVAQVSLALQRAAEAARPQGKRLRIGYTGVYADLPLHHAVRRFRAQHPDVALEFHSRTGATQADELRAGKIDVGLFQFIDCDLAGLAWQQLYRLGFVVAIPDDWPFPSDQPLDLALLSDRPFILSDPALSPEIHQAQLAYCEHAGFRPQVARLARERPEQMMLVANGFGACFLFEQALRIRLDGVRQIVIANPPGNAVTDCPVAWLAERPAPFADAFVACLAQERRVQHQFLDGGRYAIDWVKAAD